MELNYISDLLFNGMNSESVNNLPETGGLDFQNDISWDLKEREDNLDDDTITYGETFVQLEEAVDLHSQTNYSDGQQSLSHIVTEAYENGVYFKGISDHANVGNEDKEYENSFYNLSLGEVDLGNKPFTDSEAFKERENLINFETDDVDAYESDIVRWQDADVEDIAEDIEMIRKYGGEYSMELLRDQYLNYEMVVFSGFEPDYNPKIEDKHSPDDIREEIENYNEKIADFIRKAREEGVEYDFVNLAVHDVMVDGERLYVKKDELFEDLEEEKKREVWENYRRKLLSTLSTEMYNNEEQSVKPIWEILEELNVFTIGAHPAIIERNDELMMPKRRDEAEEELENFIYDQSHLVPDQDQIDIDDLTELGELMDVSVDRFLDDRDISNLYPEKQLREFWKPLVDQAGDKSNHLFESNGKHWARFPNSVLWEMLDEITIGSDHHREGEQPKRSRIASRELSTDFKTVLDLHYRQKSSDY